ncbi:P2Y purinoceptor 12-like [Carassius auratus]|uniref:P2Y purinoceptor 12-like n=1 Tax=Carassius auratus TaxID=7957 RepID=A0A6P6LAR5_CARAU|nr:P2Y purinoceptor 12-like [Carassius auratus]XP_026081718.1 P2Y purinoceptor 12-like [Carassius auratus]XP_052471907.1 P2Y purinoceptor 12-like [Carassius gibelio]XP_052471908.1 P2Y purinoceptor 12-like [Carassius gibelio]XP_052471909.1 P2Y purinoceptor 12-like [Carassius gibelio]XP_052471910.1 P2Y purinoceptor 12-like [Carassius gibelio]
MEFRTALAFTTDTDSNQTFRNESTEACSRDSALKTTVFPLLYTILFILGLSLNGLAAWVFLRIPSKSHFIIYLKNIVVADIIMTLTFPFKILADANLASVGERVFVCRVSSVLFYLTMYISILFFGLISIDRCRKTIRPFVGTNPRRLLYRKLLSGFIWTSLLALSLPNVILTSRPSTSSHFKCSDLKTEMGLKWHELVNHVCQVIFWGNLVTVIVCYTLISKELYKSYARTRAQHQGRPGTNTPQNIQANVFLVLAVFFVCFVPFHFSRVPYTISQTRESMFDCQQKLLFFQLKESTLWLSSLNSVLDPLIYFFLCKSFRSSLLNTLRLSPGRCRGLRELGTDSASTPQGNTLM